MIPTLPVSKEMIAAIVMTIFVISFYIYIGGLKDDIAALEKEVSTLKTDVAYKTLEKTRLENAIEKQNEYVEQLEANKELAMAKLKKWQKQKPTIKYRKITEVREVKSNECKQIKDSINNIRNISYSEL